MRHYAFVRYFAIVSALALFGCGKSATSPASNPYSAGDSGSAGSSGGQETANPAPAPESRPIVVAAGKEIVVTADQSVSSKTGNTGDRFDASLAAPVMVDGRVVIPRGARATGTVTDAKSAGKFNGKAEISVTLSSVRVNGQEYAVRTSEVTEAGKGRGKRTVEGAGGGAAIGALIGAIAGGGKGAAIGAGAGAGAGTAGAAFTGERDITIEAETKLTFQLREPLELGRR